MPGRISPELTKSTDEGAEGLRFMASPMPGSKAFRRNRARRADLHGGSPSVQGVEREARDVGDELDQAARRGIDQLAALVGGCQRRVADGACAVEIRSQPAEADAAGQRKAFPALPEGCRPGPDVGLL